jgi:hypothetical protein
VWALSAFVLSLCMLGLSIKNLRIPRELIIFLFALVQAGAAIFIYGTCYTLRRLLQDF